MNNTVYDVDFTRALPAPLRNDENMLALGRVIAGELQENIKLARLAVIYPRIDELDEDVLDVLARDLHVDWYEDSYPIETKRAVIKSSVRVHKRLATKYAVVTALDSVFPNSTVQEWFEYGGNPFCFRIVLDITKEKATPDPKQILQATNLYKRLTAHLDGLFYKMSLRFFTDCKTRLHSVNFRMKVPSYGRDVIVLDGRKLLDGSWLLNQTYGRGFLLRGLSMRSRIKNVSKVTGAVTVKAIWRLNGSVKLDGSKKLNADIIKEVI